MQTKSRPLTRHQIPVTREDEARARRMVEATKDMPKFKGNASFTKHVSFNSDPLVTCPFHNSIAWFDYQTSTIYCTSPDCKFRIKLALPDDE